MPSLGCWPNASIVLAGAYDATRKALAVGSTAALVFVLVILVPAATSADQRPRVGAVRGADEGAVLGQHEP